MPSFNVQIMHIAASMVTDKYTDRHVTLSVCCACTEG